MIFLMYSFFMFNVQSTDGIHGQLEILGRNQSDESADPWRVGLVLLLRWQRYRPVVDNFWRCCHFCVLPSNAVFLYLQVILNYNGS